MKKVTAMDHLSDTSDPYEMIELLKQDTVKTIPEQQTPTKSAQNTKEEPESLHVNESLEDDDKIISFSVSGRRFQTLESTLSRFPSSLIGSRESREKLRTNTTGEIFLDRNPRAFEILLTFYQTGIFEEPAGLNPNIFKQEIRYFGLVEEATECGIKGLCAKQRIFHKHKWQAKLWNVLEEPQSSLMARFVAILSLTIILLSVVSFCTETVPSIRLSKATHSQTKEALDYLEIFCIAYFSLEYLLRMIASPNKLRFFVNFLNIIDLLAIVPFYITLTTNNSGKVSIYFLRTIRLVRVFRIFKLSRYSGEMKILGKALMDSARELGVLVFFIVLGVILFSSAAYYAEYEGASSQFTSIPGAFWWSIVTMTTVGYGDEVPKTIVGKLVGAACAMCGILVIAMPIPIIVNNFTKQYARLEPVSKYWKKIKEEEHSKTQNKLINNMMIMPMKIPINSINGESQRCEVSSSVN